MQNLLKNLIRIGTVSSINYNAGKVKVSFSDKDGIVSDELPMLSFEYNMPAVNDSVLCVFLGNGLQSGFCLGKFYSSKNHPPDAGNNIYFKDILGEASIEYNKTTKTLTISAENIVFNGDVDINGVLQVDGNITATGSITGANI
jgi:phage baseplate assembly protein gpV